MSVVLQLTLLVPCGPAAASEEARDEGGELPTSPSNVDHPPAPVDYNLALPDRDWWRYVVPIPYIAVSHIIFWFPTKAAGKAWSDISIHTMKKNLTSQWVLDHNNFEINQWGHPYQGSTYFNTARSMGLNFWESVPYTAIGSVSWELLMETETPSVNDFITTTVGGVIFGEVLWRLANQVLDDSTSGGKRAWRETVGFVVNPVNGLTRLFSGKMWAKGPPPKRHPLLGEVHLGILGRRLATDEASVAGFFDVQLDYGDVTTMPSDFNPFDYFTLEAMLGYGSAGAFGSRFAMAGLTAGRKFSWAGEDNAAFGLMLDFDYLNTGRFDLGISGLGPGIVAEFPLRGKLRLFTRVMLDAAFGAMGAEQTSARREYNFGVGAAVKARLTLKWAERANVYLRLGRYWLANVSGADGHELAGAYTLGATIPVFRAFGIGAQFTIADKESLYQDYPNVSYWTRSINGQLIWLF